MHTSTFLITHTNPIRKLLLCTKLFAVLILVNYGMSSCRISRDTNYFKTLQKDTTIQGVVSKTMESKILVGDQLSIIASSLSTADDELFNKAASVSISPETSGFTVQQDGTVLLHRLGHVKAAGLTRKELATQLQTDLLPYLKEPIVHVNYLNHKIIVLGEVGGPIVLPMPEEQMNILEVLVKSGDIKKDGLRNQVMVIRENGTEKQVKMLNLEDHSIFSSPWYYVQPNDIIYVKSDYAKIKNDEMRQRYLSNMGIIASTLAFVILITNIIFK